VGLSMGPPNSTVGTRRRGMMAPQEEQELFALKPGEVSKVEQEPAGYIIYKLESRQTLSVDQVKDEISRELFRQKMDTQIKAVTASVKAEFNDQYFGSPAPPSLPPGAPGANRPPAGVIAPPKPGVSPATPPATAPQAQPPAAQPPAQSPPK